MESNGLVARVLALQVLLTVLITVGAMIFGGFQSMLSALLGGLAGVLPAAFLGLRTLRIERRLRESDGTDPDGGRTPQEVLNSFFLGEVLKLGLTVALFVVILANFEVEAPVLFLAYIATLSAYWLALFAPTKR